ncbi:hypothetical protein V6N11_063096 [Hibiscus sabdariffa]|uniref:DUF4283 domain-containing protein n=1 Tax=Hibiscus sabdariffa TaxID=183260 RepID=A0ABR2AES5_9ROSI
MALGFSFPLFKNFQHLRQCFDCGDAIFPNGFPINHYSDYFGSFLHTVQIKDDIRSWFTFSVLGNIEYSSSLDSLLDLLPDYNASLQFWTVILQPLVFTKHNDKITLFFDGNYAETYTSEMVFQPETTVSFGFFSELLLNLRIFVLLTYDSLRLVDIWNPSYGLLQFFTVLHSCFVWQRSRLFAPSFILYNRIKCQNFYPNEFDTEYIPVTIPPPSISVNFQFIMEGGFRLLLMELSRHMSSGDSFNKYCMLVAVIERGSRFYLGPILNSHFRIMDSFWQFGTALPTWQFLELYPFEGCILLFYQHRFHHFLLRVSPFFLLFRKFSMAANLNKMLAKLQFTDDEHAAIIDTTASHDVSMAVDVEFGLVGKVLSPKLVNETSFIRVFTNLWADEHVEIFPLKPGVFLFKFLTEKDSLNILKRGPWIFDGEPIVLVRFVPSMALGDYKFLKMTWWIRVYELALDMMSPDVATKIGLCFGQLDAIDGRRISGNLGEYFRLNVELSIHKPLLRCVMIGKNADGTNRICPVQYEKLDRFCFNCGLLGHELRVPIETRKPSQSQRRGIIYVRSSSSATTSSSRILNQVATPRAVPLLAADDVAVGLSEKELDDLASIASELGVAPMGQTLSMIDELVDIVQNPIEGNVTGNMKPTEIAQVADLGKGKAVIRDEVSHRIDPGMMDNAFAQFGDALTVGKDLAPSSTDFGINVSVSQSLDVVKDNRGKVDHELVLQGTTAKTSSGGKHKPSSSRSKNKADSHSLNRCGDQAGDDDTLPIAQVLKGRPEVAKKVQYDDSTVDVAIHRTLGTFRRKPLSTGIEDNKVVIAGREVVRIRHGKHRSISTAKRSRSGADLVAATSVPSTDGIEKAEAVGQPRPTH